MSEFEKRVKMLDLAKEAGVSVATVSRALRDDPRLSEKTRRTIQVLARRRGYRPDPGLSALAAYRSRVRPPAEYGKLAFITDMDRPEEKLPPLLKLHLAGTRQRARELGYDIDYFIIKSEAHEQKRLSRILYSRGIRGVVFSPLRWLPTDFDWDRFCVSSLGENLGRLGLNNVTYDHDESISATYRKLREHGYKNIGFCNIAESEFRNRYLYLASYLKCLHIDGKSAESCPPFLYDEKTVWTPIPWLNTYKFDAVMVVLPDEFLRRLEGSKYSVPERLGVAGYHLPKGAFNPAFSTYVGDPAREGMAAIDLLHALMQNNQFGIPTHERHYAITVNGSWHEGTTIRQLVENVPPLPTYQEPNSVSSSGARVKSA